MSDQIGSLIKGTKNKEFQSLAKLLSQVEIHGAELFKYPEFLNPPHKSLRLGITGPPGAGKSTLIGALIGEFRQKGLSVGVIAVDPSSPLSQGAILGDRIRYSEHFLDDQVFVRSLGTRGSLGGLSASAYLMLRAFDIYGFDIVLIETVGVGQTELEVINVADLVSVVLVPESGDSIQAMKAGLLEIADVYILNKADRPGADALLNEIKLNAQQSLFRQSNSHKAQAFKTIATKAEGITELVDYYLKFKADVSFKEKRSSLEYLKTEAKALLRGQLQKELESKLAAVSSPQEILQLFNDSN